METSSPADERDEAIARCLEGYRRRQSLGERVSPSRYRERLGDAYGEFLRIIEAESMLAVGLDEPVETLPRTFGAYTLLKEIGRGSVGVVYEALHRDLGRSVALKVLRAGLDTDREARARFQREAATCARLRSHHIVPIYDFGYVDRVPYYAMPRIEGTSLCDLCSPKAAIDVPVWCTRFADLLGGLRALHEAGIVHRDIKPSNLLLDREERLVLVDFGLARDAQAASLTSTGDILGTPMYMSPEQIMCRFDEIDPRTDIYCLGATMYEVFAGVPRFEAAPVYELMDAVTGRRPREPIQRNPALPATLNRVILKCIEPRREDRYATVRALESDLRAVAAGTPVRGAPVGRMRRAIRQVARQRRRWGWALLACLALGVGWFLRPPGKAILELRSLPGTELALGDAAFQPLPDHLRVAPGVTRVTLRREGHIPVTRTWTLRPGDRVIETVLLPPLSTTDEEAIRRLTTLLGFKGGYPSAPLPELERTSEAPLVALYWPRGRVRRVSDLNRVVLATSDEFGLDATLRFYQGDALLHSQPFLGLGDVEEIEVPQAVRDRLQPGDRVTWGIYPDHGEPTRATCDVVAEDTGAAARTQVERALDANGWSGSSAEVLRLHALAEAGLDTAVLIAAEAARAEEGPRDPAIADVQARALFRLFQGDFNSLRFMPLWAEVRAQAEAR